MNIIELPYKTTFKKPPYLVLIYFPITSFTPPTKRRKKTIAKINVSLLYILLINLSEHKQERIQIIVFGQL